MNRLLRVSSDEWANTSFTQAEAAIDRYRVLQCACGSLTVDFFKEARTRIMQSDLWDAVPRLERNMFTNSLAFRNVEPGGWRGDGDA